MKALAFHWLRNSKEHSLIGWRTGTSRPCGLVASGYIMDLQFQRYCFVLAIKAPNSEKMILNSRFASSSKPDKLFEFIALWDFQTPSQFSESSIDESSLNESASGEFGFPFVVFWAIQVRGNSWTTNSRNVHWIYSVLCCRCDNLNYNGTDKVPVERYCAP